MLPIFSCVLLALSLALFGSCETHIFNFNASYVLRNPDGVHERRVIALNEQWPLPIIKIKEDDRVIIHLTNLLEEGKNTSLHFHGLFQQGSTWMDGPQMVTQCPIPYGHTFTYNFTVTGQTGTYWYHSHSGSQYSDGLRGMFIVMPKEGLLLNVPACAASDQECLLTLSKLKYDVAVPLTIGDWYHEESSDIMHSFLNKFNPTGAEPIPQNSLFNDTKNSTWTVEPETTYFLQVVNMGMFVSQHLYLEGHTFTVVEIDGVSVFPYETESILISVAQRYGLIVKTKLARELEKQGQGAFRFVNIIEKLMLDFLPEELQLIGTSWMEYSGNKKGLPEPLDNSPELYDLITSKLKPLDDFNLVPLLKEPIFDHPDYQIAVNFTMDTLGNGVQYAMFNGVSYTAPKVPTLYTVMSAEDDLLENAQIYGSNTNTFVLKENEVIEIVVNNQDPGAHPFHLHGHTFQVLSRLEEGEDEENPITYDPENPEHNDFPEIPMQRDTVVIEANGFVVIRFKADNPGVWFFHCHVDWHLEQGLALTLVEAPTVVKESLKNGLPPSHLEACALAQVATSGNAAGNIKHWLDLSGENLQFAPLPEGFTLKGYIALAISTFLGLYGIFSIYRYGMEDVKADNSEAVIKKLYKILDAEKSNYELTERTVIHEAA